MSGKVKVRVTLEVNEPKWELMVDGYKVCDLSYVDVIEMAMQATSSLRWQKPK